MALPFLQECAAAVERLTPVMLNAAVGSFLVLGVATGAAVAMRRASAAARHEVWRMGFTAVLLLPALCAALPGWHVLPRPGAMRQDARPIEVVVELPTSELALPAEAQSTSLAVSETHIKQMDTNTRAQSSGARPERSVAITPAAPSQAAARVSISQRPVRTRVGQALPRLPLAVWLLLGWLGGSLLALSRVVLGHLSLWSLRHRCAVVTRGELFDLLERLRSELGVGQRVQLLSSTARTMPMTWGVWRARLLVPEQSADWPAGQRRDVLLHELGHVQRRDCLAQLLSEVASALYWFNPLAWVARRRMQIERERACDDLVLNSGADASSYARHLLRTVSTFPAPRLAAAIAMARQSTLEERMRAILDNRLNRRALTARGTFATILLLAMAVVPVAVLKAQPAEEPQAAGGPVRDGSVPSRGSPATRPGSGAQAGRPGFGGPRAGGRGFGGAPPMPPVLGSGPTCTFDATLYDVRLPVDQIGRLDVDALAKASATADSFEKALSALGKVQPMYRADQSVRLSGDNITIGSEMPTVTSSRLTDKGQTMNSVSYVSTGAIFTLAGKGDAAGGVDLDLSIQVAASSEGGAPITDKVSAPVMRKATLSHKGPVQPGKAFVVVSVDAGSADKDGKAVAYIGRITIGEPQPPAPR